MRKSFPYKHNNPTPKVPSKPPGATMAKNQVKHHSLKHKDTLNKNKTKTKDSNSRQKTQTHLKGLGCLPISTVFMSSVRQGHIR